MALFGLPSAVGLQGAPGDPRVWPVLVTVAGIAAALSLGVPHSVKDCVGCRRPAAVDRDRHRLPGGRAQPGRDDDRPAGAGADAAGDRAA